MSKEGLVIQDKHELESGIITFWVMTQNVLVVRPAALLLTDFLWLAEQWFL
jgi:hypothetical protein